MARVRTMMLEREWRLIVIAAAAAAMALPAPTAATPVSTATPAMVRVDGIVLRPGPDGLEPAAGARILSFNLASTDSQGNFSSVHIGAVTPFIVTAEIDNTEVRTFVTSEAGYAVIDPISEAAVRLLEADGPHSYFDQGVTAALEAVRAANSDTSFAGLTLHEAIDLAVETAAADLVVQQRIAQAIRPTPTPVTPSLTPTPTSTVTATSTHTRRVTATPRTCAGDCDHDGSVSVDEIVLVVAIALGVRPQSDCTAMIPRDGVVDVTDVVRVIAIALEGCVPPAAAADLISEEVSLIADGCTVEPELMRVCVANVGEIGSGPFHMWMTGGGPFPVSGLEAGDGVCLFVPARRSVVEIEVDVLGEVEEGSEDNNLATYDLSGLPVFPTCTPTSTPTRPPTPSPT